MKNFILTLGLTITPLAVPVAAVKVRLADANKMVQQLNRGAVWRERFILNNNDRVKRFESKILAFASQERTPEDIFFLFVYAFAEALYGLRSFDELLSTRMILEALIPQYINAILPGNPAEARCIVNWMREMKMADSRGL